MSSDDYESCERMNETGILNNLKKKNRLEIIHFSFILMFLFSMCSVTHKMDIIYTIFVNSIITLCFIVKVIELDNQFTKTYNRCSPQKPFFERLINLQPITYFVTLVLILFLFVVSAFTSSNILTIPLPR
ncbi:MAG: hypothetical protein V3575_03140 [Candidatus Absconditabacteria bacterium]